MAGASPLLVLDTDLILGASAYRLRLSAAGKTLYVALAARAFKEGERLLPKWYGLKEMAIDAKMSRQATEKWLAMLKKVGLIEKDGKGRVTVVIPE